MNKGLVIFTISLLIVVILLLGGILFVGIRGGNIFEGFKFNFSAGKAEKIIEKEFEIEDFDNVDINFDAGNVEINESVDNKVKVEIYAEEEYKDKYSVDINDRTLNIIEKKFNEFRFGINMKERKVVVTLPKGFSNNINTKTDAGNIKIANFENATVNIKADAGNINLGDVKDAEIVTDAGNVKVETVNKCKIKTDAGNVNIVKVNESLDINVNAGNVKIQEVDLKVDSKIVTDFGNVTVEKTNDLNIETKTDAGKKHVENSNRKADVTLEIETDCGNINVNKE